MTQSATYASAISYIKRILVLDEMKEWVENAQKYIRIDHLHLSAVVIIAATNKALWIIEITAEQPRIVKLDRRGNFVFDAAVPAELYTQDGVTVSNGVFNLMVGENDELILHSLNGYYQWNYSPGGGTAIQLDKLTFYNHTYRHGDYAETTGKVPIYVDDNLLELPEDFYTLRGEAFVGFNPDGSFALAGYHQREDYTNEYLVMYFLPPGELLGTARQHLQTFYKDWSHHLAFGADGSVYQLLSNPDHSVQIVQLGFPEELPVDAALQTATPTPLTPLLPSGVANDAEGQAMNTLVTFFDHLSAGKYADSAALFGGEMDEYMRQPLPGENPEEYWGYVCIFLWCLPVAEIIDVEQVADDEYILYTVFMNPDGTRFEIGACCGGDPAASPPVWQFAYPVQKIDGEWKVMRAPLFTP